MCLAGVDYVSALGYEPGIAALAAGALAPIAPFILVLVPLFGALPEYERVATAGPNGDGSISRFSITSPTVRRAAFCSASLYHLRRSERFRASGPVRFGRFSEDHRDSHVLAIPRWGPTVVRDFGGAARLRNA